MTTPNVPATVKSRAHNLRHRTGLKYIDALAIVDRPDPERQPRHRWLLTPELRGWLHGDGWRGCAYPDLWDLMDNLRPQFDCEGCDLPADARHEDCAVRFVVNRYDPDLSPQTIHHATKKYHAKCATSGLDWITRAHVFDPHVVAIPATVDPQIEGKFQVTATPFESSDPDDPPVLILTFELAEGYGEDAAPWHNELEDVARQLGFWELDSEPWGERPKTALRVVDGERPWVALRTSDLKMGRTPDHLFLGSPELHGKPPATLTKFFQNWTRRAVQHGGVLVALGPMATNGYVDVFDASKLDANEIEEALFEPFAPHRFLFALAHVVDPKNPNLTLTTGLAFGHEDGQEWTIRATHAADAPVDGDGR